MASFIPNKYVGLVGGALVSSTVFMLLHGAGDVWLNVFYFTFAMIACFLTWWTGGLEASIAVHVVNNMTSLSLTPWQDLSGLFQREAGTVTDPWQIVINLAMPTILDDAARISNTGTPYDGLDRYAARSAERYQAYAERGHPEMVRHDYAAGFRDWGSPATVTQPVAAGSKIRMGSRDYEVFLRPGHSADSRAIMRQMVVPTLVAR